MCDCFLLTSAADLDLHSFYLYLGQAGLEPETLKLHPQEWCGLQVCVTMTGWSFHFFTVTMHHLSWLTHDLFLTLTQTWILLIFLMQSQNQYLLLEFSKYHHSHYGDQVNVQRFENLP